MPEEIAYVPSATGDTDDTGAGDMGDHEFAGESVALPGFPLQVSVAGVNGEIAARMRGRRRPRAGARSSARNCPSATAGQSLRRRPRVALSYPHIVPWLMC
jgi:hypothetical protein